MTSDESRLEILKKVADGTLSIEEGSDLIGILDRAKESTQEYTDEQEPGVIFRPEVIADNPPKISGWWKALWSMILVGGAVLTGFSAFWAYRGYQRAGLGWGFWLSWLPFILGILIMLFGWILMESPWLHLNVIENNTGRPHKIAFTFPLPLKLAGWIFKTFGKYMPDEVKDKGIEELLDEIENSLKRGEPFQIDVDDKEDGDQVHIQITK